MTENKVLELYFHIPFCVRKCLYCDFLSAPGTEEVQAEYMSALISEVEGCGGKYADWAVTSIFIGGGTPSILEGHWIEALMKAVRRQFWLTDEAEITIEVNPGTVDPDKLKTYRKAGINRLSIGLQSADDKELAAIGRIHSFAQFLDTYENAAAAGFSNMNVDIMSALPEQTLESYERTLHKVLQLTPQPKHISAYSLIVEEGTPFWELERQGKLALPDEDCERLMYEETARILGEYGYYRYEISNYAKPGFECRHNCGYWQRTNYLGFGIGAASLLENIRFRNGDDLYKYLDNPLACREDIQTLSHREQMEEFMFLGLRMTGGICVLEFQRTFGIALEEVYGAVIAKNQTDGLLCYKRNTETGEEMLALTAKGLDVSNYCMAQFLLS